MPRKPRISYSGALYHVICRGDWIFKTDTEKQEYKTLLEDYKKQYDFKLYSWVILPNHAHLIIEVGSIPLSKIMQRIQQNYIQWANGVRPASLQGEQFLNLIKSDPWAVQGRASQK